MESKAIALTILKKYHRSLSDGIMMVAAYIDMDFEHDDITILHAVYDHWHNTDMSIQPEMLTALDHFVDLYESGLDNHPEREDAFYAILEAFRNQLKHDYQALRDLAGDYDDLLDSDGEITGKVQMAFRTQYEPNGPLSEETYNQLYFDAIKALEQDSVQSNSNANKQNASNVAQFGNYLAMKEFFEQ